MSTSRRTTVLAIANLLAKPCGTKAATNKAIAESRILLYCLHMPEQPYETAADYNRKARLAGRHIWGLLRRRILAGNFSPATFMIWGELPEMPGTVSLSLDADLAERYHGRLPRTLLVLGLHSLGIRYRADFDGPDGMQERLITINNHPSWVTGEWNITPFTDRIRNIAGMQIMQDLETITNIDPNQRVEE